MAGGVPGVQEDGKISGLARPDVQSSEDVPFHFLRRSQAVNPGVLHTTQHIRQTSGADPEQGQCCGSRYVWASQIQIC
jgi:hypothetical protein